LAQAHVEVAVPHGVQIAENMLFFRGLKTFLGIDYVQDACLVASYCRVGDKLITNDGANETRKAYNKVHYLARSKEQRIFIYARNEALDETSVLVPVPEA
jgi:hypothetical protein